MAQNTRALAASICQQIIDRGQSLDHALTQSFDNNQLDPNDRGFVQEMVYGVTRWYWQLDDIAEQLLKSPIRNKERVVHFVLLGGLYQILHMQTAEHAAVSESVNACQQLKKTWAKNLINGCLRQFLRQPLSANSPEGEVSHPQWLIDRITKEWPDQSAQILTTNNQKPPMCLRVNQRQGSRDEYLAQLINNDIDAQIDPYSYDGIILQQAVAVGRLPKFVIGSVSVQDTAAQIACQILQPEPKHQILDACAAPGGKAAHILEATENQAELTAIDNVDSRCQTLHETFERLQLNAQVHCADASKPSGLDAVLSKDHSFDRILIDAPCSGSGVIRRHPDIKHHRRPTDIENTAQIQQRILQTCWQRLKPGGKLLYMTCSVFPEENQLQVQTFIQSHHDAMLIPILHPNALPLSVGVQTLPGVHNMDGFYYCMFEKGLSEKNA